MLVEGQFGFGCILADFQQNDSWGRPVLTERQLGASSGALMLCFCPLLTTRHWHRICRDKAGGVSWVGD